jgi:hypothetical protein
MTEIIEKTFNVASPVVLKVNNICGSVEIKPGGEGIIQVRAMKRLDSGDEKRTIIEIVQEKDGNVKAATRFPVTGWNWLHNSQPCEVDYQIKAPHDCSLQINGVSNYVFAEGFMGTVNVKSVSGEITLRDLEGSVCIHTVSGDVCGERIAGSLSLETVSGDIDIKESQIASIKSNSVSGDVRLQISITEGPYLFKSISGEVYLTLPSDTQCTAELHSLSGELGSALPVTGSSLAHGSQIFVINGGGSQVILHSVSGDLSLEKNEITTPEIEPAKFPTSEERQDVLDSLERGELTVDQALIRLQS